MQMAPCPSLQLLCALSYRSCTSCSWECNYLNQIFVDVHKQNALNIEDLLNSVSISKIVRAKVKENHQAAFKLKKYTSVTLSYLLLQKQHIENILYGKNKLILLYLCLHICTHIYAYTHVLKSECIYIYIYMLKFMYS